MVFFTCSGCGEALKKNQVEKHRWQCRRGANVMSCIDCNKDFRGDEYQQHTKCVSEDQKYGGQNYVGKANKGEVKQEKWYEQVQRAIDSIDSKDGRLRPLLEQVKNFSNIPRKQQKFESFLANSLRVRDQSLVKAAWAAIAASVEKEKQQQVTSTTVENGKKEDEETAVDNPNNKKRKLDHNEDEEKPTDNGSLKKKRLDSDQNGNTHESNDEASIAKKFNWKKSIKKFLKSAPDGPIKLRNLRKEIRSQYESGGHSAMDETELNEFFDRAIQKLADSQFLTLDGKVVRVGKS